MCDVGGKVNFLGKRVALKRALSNIVQDALTCGSAVDVVISTVEDEIVIVVEDDRPGIAPQNIEIVFQPFRRLESAGLRDSEGFGLGLSIAQMIIEDHGGTVSLQNRSGRGLRVTIILPKTAVSLPGKPKGRGAGWVR